MTDQTITVSDGTSFYRIPLDDLDEARGDGFYVPAHLGRTIVSDGQELFEIPMADLPDAIADGFHDVLAAESDLVASLRTETTAAEADKVFHDAADDIPLEEWSPTGGSLDSLPSVADFSSMAFSTAAVATVAEKPRSGKKKRETPAVAAAIPSVSEEVPVEDEPVQEGPKSLVDRVRSLLHLTAEKKRKLVVLATNTTVHVGVLLILGAIFLPAEQKEALLLITSSFESENPVTEDLQPMELDQPIEISELTAPSETFVDSKIESMQTVDVDINDLDLSSIATSVDINSSVASALPTGELGGRSKAGRAAMVAKMGGNSASEAAVQKGLQWLALHQAEDGGWSFDHTGGECKGSCSQPGSLKNYCRNAATGMAILAMLGAGNTPHEGEFQSTVLRGVQFLLENSSAVPAGLDLRGVHDNNTGMYTHAIATTALCEALTMLQDEAKTAKQAGRVEEEQRAINKQRNLLIRQIEPAAAAAVTFIVNAQNAANGSWGYNPGADGDTSILGWQVMALKSAAHAGIRFNSNAIIGANAFLNQVQAEDGFYGYRSPQDKKPSTTAIALVCRMLSGVSREEPRLKAAVEQLSAIGPDPNNMYYNYYATQVMLNYGGDTWTKWNEKMREQLVSTQIKDGHATGSWNVADAHGGAAGRLYMTCLCTMTLEVYYRHMPLYGLPEEAEMAARKQDGETEKSGDKK